VAVALTPVLAFAVTSAVLLAEREREAVENGLRDKARAIALALDNELDASVAALQALTTSAPVRGDDYALLHQQLVKVRDDARAPWLTAAAIDGSGRVLVSLRPSIESVFPAVTTPLFLRPALASARPWLTHQAPGGSAGASPRVLVAVPVVREGRAERALVAVLAGDTFTRPVERHRLPPGASISILDAKGEAVTRVSPGGDGGGDVGSLPRPGWEGVSQFVTASGDPVYGAYARSAAWGWTAVLIVPASTVDGSWRLWLTAVIGGGLLLVLLGVALALLAARGVASPIAALARSAEALGRGEALRPPPSGITELDEVGRSFADAAAARRRAEAALRQSEARLQTTLRDIADAVIVTDADTRVTFMNPAAEALTGWKFSEARGLPLASIFTVESELTRERVESPVAAALREGAVTSADHVALVPRQGAAIPIDDSAAPIRGDDGQTTGVVLVFRDVTERRRAEQTRRESARELEIRAGQQAAVVALGQRALGGLGVDALLDEAVQALCSTLGADVCHVLELDEAGRHVVLRSAVGCAHDLVGRAREVVTAESLTGHALGSGVPVVVGDFAAETRLRRGPLLEAHGVTSGVNVVIHGRAQPYGVLAVYTVAPRTFTDDDVNFLRSIANILAAAIDRARAEAERADLLRRERAARADAESASQAKDEFLAMLGHELRNPLAAIANASQVLEGEGGAGPAQGRLVSIISRQTQHLSRMVDDLLDVARVSSGKIALSREAVDLRDIAERAVAAFREAGRTGRHELSVQMQSARVYGDPTRLQQIVWNLLDNALKYTPPGGQVHLAVTDHEGVATLRVRDTGVGVAPELLPSIFNLFVQARRSIDRAEGGLGLGLTLVRRLVELHGGTVTASSEGTGKGSEFEVRLPTSSGAAARAPAAPGPAPRPPRRILIVEDNPDAREALALLLESWGHRVEQAADGVTGFELARTTRPDVALVDVGLPGMDGYALARELRGMPDCASIRLIALTGYSRSRDRERGRAAGFDAYLVKPVEPTQLRRALEVDCGDASA
jgi:PAS domain S-box-containing protein